MKIIKHRLSNVLFLLIIILPGIFSCKNNSETVEEDKYRELPGIHTDLNLCNDWGDIFIDKYIIHNNVWNKGSITTYKQCVYQADLGKKFPFGWKWEWEWDTADKTSIKAYPEIIYGHNPWIHGTTTPYLPIKINKIKDITIVYDIESAIYGAYNYSFDIWLTDSSFPKEHNTKTEIMIWLDSNILKPAGNFIQTVNFDDEKYDFYIDDTGRTKWAYMIFVKKEPELKGSTGLHKFIEYLLENNHINPGNYLACIEFGNEVCYGKGESRFHNFRISINNKE